MPAIQTLQLVCEKKIHELLPAADESKRWEASGVMVKDGSFFVVFDNRTQIARVCNELQATESNTLLGAELGSGGYEGIAFNKVKGRFYLLVEARKHAGGSYQAIAVECDDNFNHLGERPLDFTFKSGNKGFEAIAYVRHNEVDHLLAICEGNNCQCGRKGRKPGGGRVQVFEKRRKRWKHVETIELPESLPFVDYSGMSVDAGRAAIVSQESSMLWVGEFDRASWSWRDEGQLYIFPRSESGGVRYGNIEGVAWINPSRIVVVSDRRKKRCQPDKALSEKDQSVHIFEIPS
jgi:hypothetical protein